MVKVIFHTKRNFSKRKEFAPFGSKFFPFREVPIMKRDAIQRITAFSSSLPLMCVNFSAFWLRHWRTGGLDPLEKGPIACRGRFVKHSVKYIE